MSEHTAGPLRALVGHGCNDAGVPVEMLKCGHWTRVREDIVGETNAARRRCKRCAVMTPRAYCQSCADLEALLSAAQANLLGSLGPDGKKRLEAKRAEAEARCAGLVEALERVSRFLERSESNGGTTDGQNTSLADELAALQAARGEKARHE